MYIRSKGIPVATYHRWTMTTLWCKDKIVYREQMVAFMQNDAGGENISLGLANPRLTKSRQAYTG